ncbi:hypothetical protein [Luteibaculum oceani]|uniref:GNAT family N-acetyltransferase n=1 Tax=Luteibaculum oceani TaxID=1294296 RepID=A0A5C6V1G0_9FLAO|nr:hypothetical protein [Luteibaculum oceani]TXC78804.1 hypothetical protein FRX97_06220 [Luteibaculum oceani]
MQSKFCFLSRTEIDEDRWNEKVKSLPGGKIYWQTWYLDAVTDSRWDALIGENYKWIWPLPYNRKLFGLKQVYQPVLSQQLGPLGKIDGVLYHRVLSFLKRKYVRFYQQGPFLDVDIAGMPHRINMELHLNRPYQEIYRDFGRGLKQNLKRTIPLNLKVRATENLVGLMDLTQKELAQKTNLKSSDFARIRTVLEKGLENDSGIIYEVLNAENELLNISYFFIDDRYIYNVYGASTEIGPEHYAMPFLLNYLVNKHSETLMILDFEGSDIPGVQKFFRSFGPDVIWYYQLKFGLF